jgi:hypothetical protein
MIAVPGEVVVSTLKSLNAVSANEMVATLVAAPPSFTFNPPIF